MSTGFARPFGRLLYTMPLLLSYLKILDVLRTGWLLSSRMQKTSSCLKLECPMNHYLGYLTNLTPEEEQKGHPVALPSAVVLLPLDEPILMKS